VGELLDTWQRARNLAQQAEEKLQRAEFAQGKINFVGVVPRPEGPWGQLDAYVAFRGSMVFVAIGRWTSHSHSSGDDAESSEEDLDGADPVV
jgi:hypothetical protein